MILTDALTRFTVLVPCRTSDSARDTAARLYAHLFAYFGLPDVLVSDNDNLLSSSFFSMLCLLLNVKRVFTTIAHPEANGLVERRIGVIKERLRALLPPGKKTRWAVRLPLIQFHLNSAVCSSTGVSPAFAMTGCVPSDPLELEIAAITDRRSPVASALSFINQRAGIMMKLRETHDAKQA